MVLVKIYDGMRGTYRYRRELKRLGFRFHSKPEVHWWAEVGDSEVGRLEDWCFHRKLEIETSYTRRSSDYRKAFFEAKEPNCGKKRYFCAYCGFPIRKDEVTVDHLIAVKRAQRSKFYLRLLRRMGCESVNDVRNLVPACKRCNSKKGTRAGRWVIKGLLGRSGLVWGIRWCVYLIIIAAAVNLVVSRVLPWLVY